jgi:uncharacterized protein YbjQ (UPF0145 family)
MKSDVSGNLKIIRNPMKTISLALSAAVAISLTLTACGTQRITLPIQPVTALSAAKYADESNPAAKVAVYFGSQPHPAVARRVGDASYSARVPRSTDGVEATCNKALFYAIDKLRVEAMAKGANAVINVTTRFHNTETNSATEYTCGVSTSAAIAVKGEFVVLQGN